MRVLLVTLLMLGVVATVSISTTTTTRRSASHTSHSSQLSLQIRMRDIGRNARSGPNLRGGPFLHQQPTHKSLPSKAGSRALEDYLLPTAIVPISYDVRLIPYLETPAERAFTFDGEVAILVQVTEVTRDIVLHSWDLQIASVAVINANTQQPLLVAGFTIANDDTQFFTITMDSELPVGEDYFVHVTFTGELNDEGYGFFRSQYQDENDVTRWLSVTQFQSTGARRAFPCFDQPDLKAIFTIHIAALQGWTVLANMPLLSQGDPVSGLPGWQWSNFQPSVPMSTYLVAFSTSQFASLTSTEDTRFTVWSRPEAIQNADYAVESSPAILSYYEDFTRILYDLPKLDQMALLDFFTGAMENWGLITYIETGLIYDPKEMDVMEKQLVPIFIAHEVAHQWFGNLVSPKWWSYLWLNEGFATYFEYAAVAAVGADWEMDQQYVVDSMQVALIRDASSSSHPISMEVSDPFSIDLIFDAITYQKGGALVRFMLNHLGEDKFKDGINNYLNALLYKSAVPDDLFEFLGSQSPPLPSGVTFKQMMDTWTLQAGYPVVTVTRDYAAKTATASQMRFKTEGQGPELWIIPLTYTSAENPNFENLTPGAWLMNLDVTLNNMPAANQWLIFNLKQTGFYRVNYDVTNWGLISATLVNNHGAIDPVNRVQLLDDALTLAAAGLLDYTTALGITTYLSLETGYAPWVSATFALEFIRDRMYHNQEGITLFQNYMQAKLDLVYRSVSGFNVTLQDSHVTRITRRVVTNWACAVGHTACNTEGVALFQQWQQTPNPDTNNPVDMDVRPHCYCAGVKQGGQEAFDFVHERYDNSVSYNEQGRYLLAMGCSSDPVILRGYLEESLSPTSSILKGDEFSVFLSVYSNPQGLDIAYDFLLENWSSIEEVYGNVGDSFMAISEKLNTQDHYDRMVQFHVDHEFELTFGALLELEFSMRVLAKTLAWNSAYQNTVMNFFRQ